MSAMNVAIVIVSSSCAKGLSIDSTGPTVTEYLSHFKWLSVVSVDVVADDHMLLITKQLKKLTKKSSSSPDLVLFCGGTGFTKLDVTPEAIRPCLQKEAPGLVHAMLKHSLKITPMAMCSRPVAGVINETLVLTLPGSPKGATENLDAITGVLEHVLRQLKVDSARELHDKPPLYEDGHSHIHVEKNVNDLHNHEGKEEHNAHTHSHAHGHDHGHEHSHSHSDSDSHSHGYGHGVKRHILSNSLGGAVSQRARHSPYPMIPVTEALKLISEHTPTPTVIEKLITDDDITGYILAEDVYSKTNVPNFDASIVDGYAVIHTGCPGEFPVVAVSHAAPGASKVLKSGTIVRVTTGAPIPQGTTAVIPVEETELISETADNEEHEVRILAMDVAKGNNIRLNGSDISKGELALRKGSRISRIGGELGLLASIGALKVKVYKKPVIGVLSTGDELVDLSTAKVDEPLKYGQTYDTNRPLLKQMFTGAGFQVVDLGIAIDKLNNLKSITPLLRKVDYLITTGGVSMGEMDLLKPFIEQELEGTIHFGRVAMKPGKPTTFATFAKDHEMYGKVIFALPGNPASASVTSNLFVVPSLMKFSGVVNPKDPEALPELAQVDVVLKQDAKLDPRPEYQRVYIHQENGHLVAESTGFQRSSRIGSIAGANGLVVLPSSEGRDTSVLKKGTRVSAMVIDLL